MRLKVALKGRGMEVSHKEMASNARGVEVKYIEIVGSLRGSPKRIFKGRYSRITEFDEAEIEAEFTRIPKSNTCTTILSIAMYSTLRHIKKSLA